MSEPQSIWPRLFRTAYRLDWIDVGSVSTRYLEAGDPASPAVLLLHGTAGSIENFCANIEALAKDFHVLAIDMLGCGYTDKPDYDYAITDYAKHALDFMSAMKIETASIIGVSLGSWVAAAMAKMAPARVRKIVMVSAAGILSDPVEEQKIAEGIRKRRMAAAETPNRDTVRAAMVRLVRDPAALSEDLISVRLAIYSEDSMKRAMPHLLAFSLGGQHLSEEDWRAMRQPILAFAAVDAPGMFVDNARLIGKTAPNARVVDIGGCDHWAQYERADEFNRTTINFLQDA